MRQHLDTITALLLAGAAAALVVIFSGWYNIGADDPHRRFNGRLIEALRGRSIEQPAEAVKALPRLEGPQLVLNGAGRYAAMCRGCNDPRVADITIKHGIKLTDMPAWRNGKAAWRLVAFANRLSGMTPQQYQDIARRAPPVEEMAPHDQDQRKTHSDAPMQILAQATTPMPSRRGTDSAAAEAGR